MSLGLCIGLVFRLLLLYTNFEKYKVFLGYLESENLMKPNQGRLTVTAKDPQNGRNFEKGENTNKS